MFEKLRLRSIKSKVLLLYVTAFIVRIMAFLRYYALSHYFGASTITDTYLFYLFVLETVANILVSNHALTLLMRLFTDIRTHLSKRETNKQAYADIMAIVSILSLVVIAFIDLILLVFYQRSLGEILFLTVVSYMFVMSIAMQAIANFLKIFEAAAYQDLLGQFIMLLGIVGGHKYILYASLFVYSLVRFLMLYRYLYKAGYMHSVGKLLLGYKSRFKEFVKTTAFKEMINLMLAFGISSIAMYYQTYLIKSAGVGMFSMFSYAQRIVRAISAAILLPVLPVFARHLLELKTLANKKEIIIKVRKYFLYEIIILSLSFGLMWIFASPLLKFFLLHGQFTYNSYLLTLQFYKALLITLFTFNIMTFLIQLVLVFGKAKSVLIGYLLSSIVFVAVLALYTNTLGIINVQFWAYLLSGLVFLVYQWRAIMNYIKTFN